MSGTPAGKSGRQLTELKSRRFSAPSRARGVRRPEEITRDVRGLKLRQRVSLVLNDKTVRDELEEIVSSYYQNGPRPGNEGYRTYQDFLIPSSFHGGGQMSSAVIPIADIRGSGTLNYSKQERFLRCKLASVYRLIDMFGWNRSIYEHSSARSSSEEGSFLLNPFGLLYHEITASNLIKVDHDGNIKDGGSTNLGVSNAGVIQHSAIYEARKDIKAVIHLHSPAIAAVSIMKCGLLPLTTESCVIGEVTYHDFKGVTLDKAEKESLAKDLGEKSFVMILRNHGVLVCGETVEAAFRRAHILERACQFQINAISAGIDNLIKLDDDVIRQCQETGGANQAGRGPNMKIEEIDFEAWMRMLDAMGYKTGYSYRNPDLFVSEKRDVPEVTSPATTTSLRQNLFNTPDRQPIRRAHSTGRANTYRNRVKWLNTPVKSTEYKKEKAELIEQPEPVTVKDRQPERADKDAVQAVEEAMEQVKISTSESAPPGEEKGAHDAETREHREYKKTVVVTRITKTDGGEPQKTTETTTTHIVNGEEVEGLKPPSMDDLDKSDGELTDGSQDMLDKREGEQGGSSEPGSPTKKGKKVKKSRSFKQKFQKMLGKKEKTEKEEGEKATAEKTE